MSILDGIEDPNSELFSKASYTLKQISKQIGIMCLYESVWNAILKSKKSRLSGISFLNKNIPPYALFEGNINTIENYCPDKNNLVINALISCLADDSNLLQKATLELLKNHFPIVWFDNINKTNINNVNVNNSTTVIDDQNDTIILNNNHIVPNHEDSFISNIDKLSNSSSENLDKLNDLVKEDNNILESKLINDDNYITEHVHIDEDNISEDDDNLSTNIFQNKLLKKSTFSSDIKVNNSFNVNNNIDNNVDYNK